MIFVRATDHALAAGRDIVINIDAGSPALVRAIVEEELAKLTGRPNARIRLKNNKSASIEDMNEYTHRISAVAYVQAGDNRSKFRDYAADYLHRAQTNERIWRLFNGVDQSFRKKDFKRAHLLLGKLLEIKELTDERDDIIENYLVSGYIYYANTGNTSGMLALIEEAQQNFFGTVNESIEYLLIEVQQEIATRQQNDTLLHDNEHLLLDFLARKEIAPEHSGLLGLLYRRLGERGSVAYLRKAEDVFRAIQRKRKSLNVEEANNFGIALIRDFELTQDASKLDEALQVLTAIDFNTQKHPLPDYLSLPKAINNIGNAYKQKLVLTKQSDFYAQAIENYTRAERYWSEKSAPYEWAMLQKNKAETRVTYFHISGKVEVLSTAAEEITASLKYRTEAQSPYQFARSMAVKQKIDQALAQAG